MKVYLLLILLSFSLCTQAQKFTISGQIQDESSGEKLIGVNIYDSKTFQGTTSNVYGFYSLTLEGDTHDIVFSFVGFGKKTLSITKAESSVNNIELNSSVELKEVEIVAEQTEKIQENTQMSAIMIPMDQIKSLPVFLGEKDILKTIQLLPGVQSGGEGTSGLYVRGGGPDQNLILLDGVPVYNASHLFGFFSVFNPDAVNSVQLIKGGYPARYGGRLSSVLDIRMKEGNSKEFHGEGSVGVVASKLTLEGPIIKDKCSFIVSGRRTYIDLLAQPFIAMANSANGGGKTKAGYYFYDLNTKLNYVINDKNRLFLSNYMGRDKAYAKYEDNYLYDGTNYTSKFNSGLGWGNVTSALRWNSILNQKTFINTTLTYSRYQFDVGMDQSEIQTNSNGTNSTSFNILYKSGIYDFGAKADIDFIPNPNHYIKGGINEIYHTFTPGVSSYQSTYDNANLSIDTSFGSDLIYAHEYFTYLEDDIKLGGKTKVNVGAHFSGFLVNGRNYFSLQPRASVRYLLNENFSLKASYAEMTQYMHLLTNSSIGLPTDLWLPATDSVLPQRSRQTAAGIAWNYKNEYEITVEGYYKNMYNLIEYKDGASFFNAGTDWQEKIETGDGWSYGAEFFVQKKTGKTTGWIGYTLSWTMRQFENLNFGEKYPYRYDRRHDIGLAVTHKFNDKIDVGLVWVYGTGNAVTLGTERYEGFKEANPYYYGEFYGFHEIENYENRNDFRMPNYHRLDVGVNIHKEKKWGEATWSFGLYNAYNKRNPFYLEFGTNDDGNRILRQISLFPIIPSVSYQFKF